MASEFGPIPLIIGVTGHRDLPADVDSLERAVCGVLRDLHMRHPSSRIIVLSSLAEGADRLVARIALDLGLSLVVPMPFERAEYENDFVTEESLREFRSLLERADASFAVPQTNSYVGDPRGARSHAYANCGAYLVRSSIEIIALWDGVAEPSRGTAEVVTFQLEGVPAPYVPRRKELDLSVVGPVQHVTTQRGANGGSSAPATSTTLYPRVLGGSNATHAYEKAKADIDRFNREAVRSGHCGSSGASVRECASAVANEYHRRTTAALTTMFVMVFLSVVGFNVYSSLPQHPLWLLIGYLVCIAAAFGAYSISKRGDWQNRYQDCRAFAELLRVGHYWKRAGVPDSVAEAFAESNPLEVSWLPFAIRAVSEPFVSHERTDTTNITSARLREVYDDWIARQYQYFSVIAGARERRRSRITKRLVSAALLSSILLSIAMRLVPILGFGGDLDQAVLFAATVLAVVAALLDSYADKSGWAEHSRRYGMMAVLFARARDKIGDMLRQGEPDDHVQQRIRDIIRSLGEESIREGTAWLSLHRSRPIDVPQA